MQVLLSALFCIVSWFLFFDFLQFSFFFFLHFSAHCHGIGGLISPAIIALPCAIYAIGINSLCAIVFPETERLANKCRRIYKMSVRVVSRIRPLLKSEREMDVIVRTGSNKGEKKNTEDSKALAALRDRDTIVRIPNPKHEHEEYSFQFNAVYDADVPQQELFDAEGV